MPTTVYKFEAQGGPDIVRLFESIGRAAELTQQRIERSSQQASVGVRALDQTMQGLQGTVQGLASSLGGPLGRGLSALSSAGAAGVAVAGIGALAGITVLAAKRAADYADALLDQADAVGISVEKFQELIFIGRTVGVSQDAVGASIQKFAKNVGDAERGQGRFVKALQISNPELLKTLTGTGDLTDKLDAYLAGLSKIEDPARRVSLLIKAFGDGAVGLAGVLHAGAGGLAELTEEAQKTGNVLSENLLRSASKVSDEFEKFKGTIKNQLVAGLLELGPFLQQTVKEFEFLDSVLKRLAETVLHIPDFSGISGKFLEGAAGEVTTKLTELERKLEEAQTVLKRAKEAAAAPSVVVPSLLPAPPGGDAVTKAQETVDALTKQIVALGGVRQEYVTTADAAKRAADEQAAAARKGEQSVEDYANVLKGLKPQLDEINDKEKQSIARINAAVAAGKAGIAGAPSAAEGAHQIERVKADAQKARDALETGAKRQADALKNYTDQLKETGDATDVFSDKVKQLAEGVLPKDLDKTREVIAQGEKLRQRLVELAEKAGVSADAANAQADAWIKTNLAYIKAAEGAERNAKTLKENEEQLKRSDKLTQDLNDAVEATKHPFDEQADAIAKVNKKWDDYLERVHGTAHALGEAVPAVVAADEALVKQGRANELAEVSAKELGKTFEDVFGKLEGIVEDTFRGIIDGTLKGADAFKALEASIAKTVIQIALDLAKSGLADWFKGGTPSPGSPGSNTSGAPTGGGLLSILGKLGGLFGGGGEGAAGPAVAGATAEAGASEAVATGAENAASGLSSLTGSLAVLGAIAVSVGFGIKAAIDDANTVRAAARGTSNAGANVLLGVGIGGTVAGVVGGAAIGAAVGTIVPGIGNVVGAAVGAAVGGAVAQAVNKSLSKDVAGAINSGVKSGITQAQLEASVSKRVGNDLLLNILSLGANKLIAPILSPLVTPDIEKIFAKILREIIGSGTGGLGGGFSTAGIPVGSQSFFGLKPFAPQAGQEARILAESFGAGGEAFGDKRRRNFIAILLGAAKKEMERTGEDAATVLAQIFAAAFGGQFLAALRVTMGEPVRRQQADTARVVRDFQKAAPSYGFDFRQQAAIIDREGIVPGGKAAKASREAFGKAFSAALQDGADSDAFRKSLQGSVQEAFIAGASKALTSGPLGTAFASLFSVSNKAPTFRRRRLRLARRRGDTVGQIKILSAEFQQDVQNFADIVRNPAFAKAIQDFNDQLLKLQVATSVAAGDINGAADAIIQRLAPAIKLVNDIAEEQRDLTSKAAVALAEPGFPAAAAEQAARKRFADQQEKVFRAKEGGAGLEDFKRLLTGDFPHDMSAFLDKTLVAADTALRTQDPAKLFADFKAFADARVDELTGEIDLLRSLKDAFKQAEDAFRAMEQQIDQALGRFNAPAENRRLIAEATAAGAKAIFGGGFETDPTKAHPELLADFTTKMGLAVASVISTLQFFEQAVQQATALEEQARVAIGGRTAQNEILNERLAKLSTALPKALVEGPEQGQAITDSLSLLSDAIQGTAARLQFFKAAVESFRALAESTDSALRGLDATADLLAKRTADLTTQAAKAKAKGTGAEDAFDKAQKDATEAIGFASQLFSFFKGAAESFQAFADQADVLRRGRRGARQQLSGVRADIETQLAAALGGSAEALANLQKLLPQALQLGQQGFTGARLRSLERYLQQIAELAAVEAKRRQEEQRKNLLALGGVASDLSDSAQGQATDAEKQLGQLEKNADSVRAAADAGSKTAKTQLETLEGIAEIAKLATGAGLSTTDTLLLAAQQALQTFIDDSAPMLAYLAGKAGATLEDQFKHIANLLGDDPNSPLLLAIRGAQAQLPDTSGKAAGGPVGQGQSYLVGERGPELFTASESGRILSNDQLRGGDTYQLSGPLVVFQNAPRTQAEADEYGRTLGDAFERRVMQFQARQRGLKKVA